MYFYIYEWYIKDTNEVFYVGKGCRNRWKETYHRNKIFYDYLEHNNCDSRIIEYFESEYDAFWYEKSRIYELKEIGQAKANIDEGGKGGPNFVWTDEMRRYKSEHNPMKEEHQRARLSINNPMKDPDTAFKVSEKLMRPLSLRGVKYPGITVASELTGHGHATISKWCKRGYDYWGNSCYFLDEGPKEIPLLKQLHPNSNNQKAVLVDGIRFETVEDGAEYIGVWSESLIRAIKHNRLCKGHSCRYANQQPSTDLNDQ